MWPSSSRLKQQTPRSIACGRCFAWEYRVMSQVSYINASSEGGSSRHAMQRQVPLSECCCRTWCYTTKDINPEMFNKEAGKAVEEFKLRVVYIPANPPTPVPEEPEEGLSPTFI